MSTQPHDSIPGPVLQTLRETVGEAHVLTAASALAPYMRDISPWETVPGAVVLPASTEEVQAVMVIANRVGLRVWPFSGGHNWGYGAAMALRHGALVMILHRMNRIREVDTELAYAVIEPGVTQGQLREHLDATGSGLWTDCTDSTPHGSVIGNALEHGVGYTPYSYHFTQLCGLEVVLPDGRVAWTGGTPGHARTLHTYRSGTGPSLAGLFGQSNYGIVTRAGIWLMPEPEDFRMMILQLERPEQLPALVDDIRRAALRGTFRSNIHILNEMLYAAVLGPYPEDLLGPGDRCLSDAGRARLRERHQVAPWSAVAGLYGSKRQVRAQVRELEPILRRHGRIRFMGPTLLRVIDGVRRLWRRVEHVGPIDRLLRRLLFATPAKLESLQYVRSVLTGTPTEYFLRFAYFKGPRPPETDRDPARDGAGMIWMTAVVPLQGSDVERIESLCRPLFEDHGFDYSCVFIMINERSTMALMQIWYRRESQEEAERARALQHALAATLHDAGYPQYRTGLSLYGSILPEETGFADLARRIKHAVDPADVLAPGRYGLGGEATHEQRSDTGS